MKKLLHFINKEFRHILRDPRTLAVIFGLPLIQLLVFGYAVRNEVENVDIAFYDQSGDEVTREIQSKIVATDNFQYAGSVHSPEGIEQCFRAGKAKVVVSFGPDFAKKMYTGQGATAQLILDATDPNIATTVRSYLTAILGQYQASKTQEKGSGPKIRPEVRMLYNENLSSANLFVPGILAVIMLLVSAMVTAIALTKEKELGTMEVLLASPLRPWMIIVGKLIPYLLISFFNLCIILFIGTLVFGVPIKGSLALLFFEAFLFLGVSLALGTLISITSESQQVALMKSLFGMMIPSMLLTGFIFPIENMPLPLQWISTLIPARWFIVILRSIMLKGSGILSLWPETVILLGMFAALVGISMKKFKIRLEP
ncbi:transport permease protein (plasmid) [Fulvitalea axinellae]|uniref:Transport permease protein n=1 Tax=Fulvitalea axinellae TaxID=1182444 RepID=A0AAU9DB62_9BACT|nr:transport permease protein [Fulvitalea axinellae]